MTNLVKHPGGTGPVIMRTGGMYLFWSESAIIHSGFITGVVGARRY